MRARPGGIATFTRYGSAHYRAMNRRVERHAGDRSNPTNAQALETPKGRAIAAQIARQLGIPRDAFSLAKEKPEGGNPPASNTLNGSRT